MKKFCSFHQSNPLYCNDGDFPLDQINSKDFYQESSPQLPKNKLELLKEKKQKSLERTLNKSCDNRNIEKIEHNPEKESSFIKFLEKEREFQLKAEDNVQKLKEMIEFNESLEFSSTPTINKQNAKILENNPYIRQPVFTRLYEDSKKHQDSFQEIMKESFKDFNFSSAKELSLSKDLLQSLNKSFNKSLNKSLDKSFDKSFNKLLDKSLNKSIDKSLNRSHNKSTSEVDQSLYQDAMRRIEKEKTKRFARNLSLDFKESRTNLLKKKSEEKSQINILHKLHKEVYKIIEELHIDKKLTYLQTLEIMNRMGFLKYHKVAYTANLLKSNKYFLEERILNTKMWDLLNKEKEETIDVDLLIKFLAGVIGLRAKEDMELNDTIEDEQGCLTFNRTEEKIEIFDHVKIHRDYEIFYRNRLGHEKQNQKPKKDKKTNIKISKNSENLAIQHYKKLLDDNESIDKLAVHELLARKHAVTQAKIVRKSEENTQKIMEHCTFKPQVKIRSTSNPRKLITELGKPKIISNYKKTEEIEYEKQKNECTFKPDLNKSFKKPVFNQKLVVQQKKNIERIENARIERGFQRSFKERGILLKNDVLKDIGNLTVSNVNPELIKKYFGPFEKNESKNIVTINKSSSIAQTLKTENSQTQEGFYTRIIQKEYDSMKEKNTGNYICSDSEKFLSARPILFLEINLGEGKFEKISVFEDTNPTSLAEEFAKKHNLNENLLEKLKQRFSYEIKKKKQQEYIKS